MSKTTFLGYVPSLKEKHEAKIVGHKAIESKGGSIRYTLQGLYDGRKTLPKTVSKADFEGIYGFDAKEAESVIIAGKDGTLKGHMVGIDEKDGFTPDVIMPVEHNLKDGKNWEKTFNFTNHADTVGSPSPASVEPPAPSESPFPQEPSNENFSAECEECGVGIENGKQVSGHYGENFCPPCSRAIAEANPQEPSNENFSAEDGWVKRENEDEIYLEHEDSGIEIQMNKNDNGIVRIIDEYGNEGNVGNYATIEEAKVAMNKYLNNEVKEAEGGFYQLEVKYNMEDGWEHIADFNNEQKAINSYYDYYLNHPEVQLVDSEGDVLYRQRNHNVKGKQRDERLEAENTCAECGEIVADEDIIGDGTNRGLCCVPDYYDEDYAQEPTDEEMAEIWEREQKMRDLEPTELLEDDDYTTLEGTLEKEAFLGFGKDEEEEEEEEEKPKEQEFTVVLQEGDKLELTDIEDTEEDVREPKEEDSPEESENDEKEAEYEAVQAKVTRPVKEEEETEEDEESEGLSTLAKVGLGVGALAVGAAILGAEDEGESDYWSSENDSWRAEYVSEGKSTFEAGLKNQKVFCKEHGMWYKLNHQRGFNQLTRGTGCMGCIKAQKGAETFNAERIELQGDDGPEYAWDDLYYNCPACNGQLSIYGRYDDFATCNDDGDNGCVAKYPIDMLESYEEYQWFHRIGGFTNEENNYQDPEKSEVNMVGHCGVCSSSQSYHPDNMMLMADRPDIDWDSKPDVYPGQTWYCQGCGSGTEFLIDANKWEGNAETFEASKHHGKSKKQRGNAVIHSRSQTNRNTQTDREWSGVNDRNKKNLQGQTDMDNVNRAETFEATTGYEFFDPSERMTDEEGWLELHEQYKDDEEWGQMTLEEFKKDWIKSREEDYQMQVKYEQRLKDEGRDMDGNPINEADYYCTSCDKGFDSITPTDEGQFCDSCLPSPAIAHDDMDATTQKDDFGAESKNIKMALGITAIGIGLAAVLGKDKITKLFDRFGL